VRDYRTSEEIRYKMKALKFESPVYEFNGIHLILSYKTIPNLFKYTI